MAYRPPDPEARGGTERAQVLCVLHPGEEEQRGVRHSQHGRHLHHLGPCVGTSDGEDHGCRMQSQLLNSREDSNKGQKPDPGQQERDAPQKPFISMTVEGSQIPVERAQLPGRAGP